MDIRRTLELAGILTEGFSVHDKVVYTHDTSNGSDVSDLNGAEVDLNKKTVTVGNRKSLTATHAALVKKGWKKKEVAKGKVGAVMAKDAPYITEVLTEATMDHDIVYVHKDRRGATENEVLINGSVSDGVGSKEISVPNRTSFEKSHETLVKAGWIKARLEKSQRNHKTDGGNPNDTEYQLGDK